MDHHYFKFFNLLKVYFRQFALKQWCVYDVRKVTYYVIIDVMALICFFV